MSAYGNRLNDSPVKSQLTAAQRILSELDPLPTDPQVLENINQVINVLRHVQTRFSAVDPRLISVTTLGALESNAERLEDAVRQFIEDRDEQRIRAALDQCDGLLVHVSQLPPTPLDDAEDVVRDFIEPIRQEIGGLKTQLDEQVSQFRSESEELSTQLQRTSNNAEIELSKLEGESKNRQNSLDTKIETTETQFQRRADSIRSQVDVQVTRLDAVISTTQDRYAAAEENRAEQFRQAQVNRESASQEQSDEAAHQLNELLTQLRDSQDQAEHVLAISAASGTAAAYVNEAEHQRRQADLWRWISVGTFFVATVVGIIILFLFVPEDASAARWAVFYASRLAVLAGVVAVAGVALRESGQHRSRERENMRLASELTTFRPFLAELSGEERSGLIGEASHRYFPGHADTTGTQPSGRIAAPQGLEE